MGARRDQDGKGDELHLSFYFWFLEQHWRATPFRAAVGSFDAGLPVASWANYTLRAATGRAMQAASGPSVRGARR